MGRPPIDLRPGSKSGARLRVLQADLIDTGKRIAVVRDLLKRAAAEIAIAQSQVQTAEPGLARRSELAIPNKLNFYAALQERLVQLEAQAERQTSEMQEALRSAFFRTS